MRIERIRTIKDLAKWVGDQAGHIWYIVAGVEPVLLFGPDWGIPISGVLLLGTREWEQYRSKDRSREMWDPFWKRHVDRVVDVVLPTAICSVLWYLV